MFGNSELKETKLKLDIAINIATEIFTGMDPVMRPIYLRKYKSMIDHYDRIMHGRTFTNEIWDKDDSKYVNENKDMDKSLYKIFGIEELAPKALNYKKPSSNKEANSGSVKINCDSPVWKNKPRCN